VGLRKKTLLIISGVILALIAGQYLITYYILINDNKKIEQNSVYRDLARAHDAFTNELSALDRICRDYAYWDDTYRFMIDSNQSYIETNIVPTTFTNLNVDYIFFVKNSGKILHARYYDDSSSSQIPVPLEIAQEMERLCGLQLNNAIIHCDGVLVTESESLIISINSILTSDAEGFPHGQLIMGRKLDEQYTQHLSTITHMRINIYNRDKMVTPIPGSIGVTSQESDFKEFIQPIDQETVAGYTIIKDVFGQSKLVLSIIMPRDIYKQGLLSAWYFTLSTVVIALTFGIVIFILMEKLVLSRLVNLTQQVGKIANPSDLRNRVYTAGDDELHSLAVTINHLLTTLEHSNEELRLNETFLRSMSDSSPLGFLMVDTRAENILFFNRRFCEICGIESLEAELRSRNISAGEVINQCSALQIEGQRFKEFFDVSNWDKARLEIIDEIPLRNGQTIRCLSSQVKNQLGEHIGRLYILEDVTVQRE
jgi:sensor domain CHASE-containing protein